MVAALIWCSLYIFIFEMSRVDASLKSATSLEYLVRARRIKRIKWLVLYLQFISTSINIFSQVTARDRDFYQRHEPVLIALRIINTCIQVPNQFFVLYTFLKHTSFFSHKAQSRGIIMAGAITWVGLTLVNVIHVVVVRAVGILGRQKEPWFLSMDGFLFKVYRPTMMLAEVITLAIIIVKISKRHKVIENDEDEDDNVFNAILASGALTRGHHKN